jgi:hypothetical protein
MAFPAWAVGGRDGRPPVTGSAGITHGRQLPCAAEC